jgi:hypothetical protein
VSPTREKTVKQIALSLGIVLGLLALSAFTTFWEPQSAVVKAHSFGIGALLLCYFLVRYGLHRPTN